VVEHVGRYHGVERLVVELELCEVGVDEGGVRDAFAGASQLLGGEVDARQPAATASE